jgi:hypothetical protein
MAHARHFVNKKAKEEDATVTEARRERIVTTMLSKKEKCGRKIYLRLLRGEENSQNSRQLYTEICKCKT